jgi:hypothetical protein
MMLSAKRWRGHLSAFRIFLRHVPTGSTLGDYRTKRRYGDIAVDLSRMVEFSISGPVAAERQAGNSCEPSIRRHGPGVGWRTVESNLDYFRVALPQNCCIFTSWLLFPPAGLRTHRAPAQSCETVPLPVAAFHKRRKPRPLDLEGPMSMSRRFAKVVLLAVALQSSAVLAANSVVVESRNVQPGAVAVPIHVMVTNDLPVAFAAFPFEIRTVTGGAFIINLRVQLADRLGAIAWPSMDAVGFANPDGLNCSNGHPGGYHTQSWSGLNTTHLVGASPEGVRVQGWRLLPGEQYLQPGTDVTGSIVLTVTVLASQGVFEIDTTCMDPAAHLMFGDTTGYVSVVPSFTKGIITVGHPVVVNLNDAGPGSLRDAIQFANSHVGLDSITFAVAGVINLLSPLPSINDSSGATKIFGFTAPGALFPSTPTVVVDGSSATPGTGLMIASSFNYIEGLTFRNFKGAGVGGTALVFGNTITKCRFYGNTGPGIDLGNNGITPNDPGDGDVGFNNLANFPVVDSVIETAPNTFTVKGTTSLYAIVELYLAAEAGDSAYQPESTTNGPAYLFLREAFADPGGKFVVPAVILPEWSRITTTATDTVGNTSEFSTNVLLTPDPLAITAYSEPVPPLPGMLALSLVPAAIQIIVHSPLNSLGLVDSIGPTFNTFGSRGVYQSTTDYNAGGILDARVTIQQPDTGIYTVDYILIGSPGNYLTGIGIDGHAEVHQQVAFAAPGQDVSTTFDLAPPSRGDLTGDGVIDVFDVIASIDIIFSGAPPPSPPGLVDVNCDEVPDVFDVIYLIDYSFSGGPQPCQ